MVCTFFGHRNAEREIQEKICDTIIYLIEHKRVDKFYVGNHGNFDYMVQKALSRIKTKYPHISFSVVLAYMPKEKNEWDTIDFSNTEYPDALATVPRRFAVDRRNFWMLERSDYIITYVTHDFGGAAKFKEIAKRRGKIIIEI